MRKSTISLLSCVFAIVVLLQSCKDDAYLATAPATPDQTFTEEFDTVANSLNRGWKFANVSNPTNANVWQQGGDVIPWFAPYSSNGSYAGFIGASALIAAPPPGVTPVISNWLISPVVIMQNGDKITFYTRAAFDVANDDDYGNRLQVRINPNNQSLNVGASADPGDFRTILLDINPNYESQSEAAPSVTAFPGTWTRFEATVYGLDKPTRGRFAFRYFIEDANVHGWGIGIDKVTYTSVNHK
ncbi:MAG: hypothetical protein C4329_07210 [Chitinophagaceae bacterium]